jgi:5-enolpyruvylshikimate-3-phosphate synthase
MNCGESGLGIRMFTPIAALSDQSITINGSGSLLKRPMHFFDTIFPQLGIEIQSQAGYLPIQIKGPLKPVNIEVDGSLSSQFLTGLLMAYAASDATNAVIQVKDLKSKRVYDDIIYMTPDGETLNQHTSNQLSLKNNLMIFFILVFLSFTAQFIKCTAQYNINTVLTQL